MKKPWVYRVWKRLLLEILQTNPQRDATCMVTPGIGSVVVYSLSELKEHIERSMRTHGPSCNLNHLDVSRITDMKELFRYTEFNGDISCWDVRNVKSMYFMFANSPFNNDISRWNVSNVETFSGIFYKSSFNNNLAQWDTSRATKMDYAFHSSPFNKDISKWDTSNVLNMERMFSYTPFQTDISDWNTSRVTNMTGMFSHTVFNGDLSSWNVGCVTAMSNMFCISKFNRDLSNWNVSNVQKMDSMFYVSEFNHDISKWNIKNLLNAYWMFRHSAFNKDLSSWDLREVNTGFMLDTSTFQSSLPRLPMGTKGPVLDPLFRGTINSDLNLKTARNIFGSMKIVDQYLKDTACLGLTRLHLERALTITKKPVWCTAEYFAILQDCKTTYKMIGIDAEQWPIYAHQNYREFKDILPLNQTGNDEIFDDSLLSFVQ